MVNFPKIDFKYWYNKNIEDSNTEPRFKSMITKINNIYENNNNLNQAYFCGDKIEINRLKNLNYNQLENEILNLIKNKSKKNVTDFSDNEILQIFDLIQIWGGLTGGSNPYQIKNNKSVRLNYEKWIKDYRNLINLSIEKNIKAYEFVLKKNIPCLNMSFGSKHISFWSRKKVDDNKCLIVIDNKISGVSGVKIASKADYNLIIKNVHKIASEINMKPYQIEKALFTFHKFYFDNNNSKFKDVNNNSRDYHLAINLKECLKIGLTNFKGLKSGNKVRQTTNIIISKKDIMKVNETYYISSEYISKNSKIKKLTNTSSTVEYKTRLYFMFVGNINNLLIN